MTTDYAFHVADHVRTIHAPISGQHQKKKTIDKHSSEYP
jgi:hypothetical protein